MLGGSCGRKLADDGLRPVGGGHVRRGMVHGGGRPAFDLADGGEGAKDKANCARLLSSIDAVTGDRSFVEVLMVREWKVRS